MAIERDNVEKTMREFAHNVVRQAKLNLLPGRLKESIESDLDVFQTGNYSLAFLMEEYGLFQDMGVSGTKVKYNTRFTYKNKQPPSTPIANWAKKKFIRFRDKDGKFTKANYKSIGFVIARSIKRKGIKPSLFFTKPFRHYFTSLPDDIVEAYGLDLDTALDSWLVDENYTNIKVT